MIAPADYWAWREEVTRGSGNWLQRAVLKAVLPASLRQTPQPQAIGRTRARLSWEQGPPGFINPFFKIPQQQNLYLLEQIPGLIPSVSAALRILTQLVGCPKIESSSKAAAEEANEWWEGVNVNQIQTGGGNWFAGHCKDHLLYGRAHAEIIPTARYQDVFALQSLHPRSIELKPRETYGVDLVQWQNFGMPQVLEPRELFLTSVHDLAQDNPNGTSILAALPNVSAILNKMLVSLSNTWERYGTPTWVVIWDPPEGFSDPSGTKASAVIGDVVGQLEQVALAKANGKTRDIAAAGKYKIEILGAAGEELDIEVPWRAILEEITSVFGIPTWMLGKNWSNTEKLSAVQASLLGEIVDEVREHLEATVRQLFTMRQLFVGQPFEFDVAWEAPSLIDQMETAQAAKTESEARSARLKVDERLWTLGIKVDWEVARDNREDLEGKTEAEVRAACPDLVAMPTPIAVPAGPGEEQGGPPRPSQPFGRSITYGEELLTKNGNGHNH